MRRLGLSATILISAMVFSGTSQADEFPAAPPDYLSGSTVGLTPKEKEALRIASEWSERPVKPVHSGSGKVVYVLGATMPTVIGAPMQICDVELQPGEQINEILVGDSARWLIETGVSGTAQGPVTHLFIKPVDSGLQTSLAVTTDRRVYHLKLVSQRQGHTPYVGFLYPEQTLAVTKKASQEKIWQTANINGQTLDMAGLNFSYEVKGKAPWKPVQVYDDGRQMFVRLPEAARRAEVPVLLVRQGKQDIVVNYRLKNNTLEVDGIFDHLILVSGVGGNQRKVEIKKEAGKI